MFFSPPESFPEFGENSYFAVFVKGNGCVFIVYLQSFWYKTYINYVSVYFIRNKNNN